MYHEKFYGTHYEAGLRWGAALFKKGKRLLENVPFPITGERVRFAKACRPFYEKWYPEVLEEIRGIEEGQQEESGKLEAVLLSMYCILPENRCSCLAFREGEHIILGRNSDFLAGSDRFSMNGVYRLNGGYASFQGNTTSFVEMEDGVNEHGFAVGLTSVYPACRGDGLNAGMLLRYGLERCRTVEAFIRALEVLPVASCQTFTAVDKTGAAAVIECGPMGMEVCRLDEEHTFVAAVNAFHLDAMKPYRTEGIDDWDAEERYKTIRRAFEGGGTGDAVFFAMEILKGTYGFLCQYDRKTGKDTVWSAVYDVGPGRIWRCEGNPSRKNFQEDGRFRF
ncbi:MAG: acyl-CoA--6-aminopenicillanic acid acyltransferase [Lachnospiraceae bacterium]|nr:acyl-CoA--6-aminopenicillanic acid acyltransferase [Lachnospiraceae bacterium]